MAERKFEIENCHPFEECVILDSDDDSDIENEEEIQETSNEQSVQSSNVIIETLKSNCQIIE